jgi:hypothetical protein
LTDIALRDADTLDRDHVVTYLANAIYVGERPDNYLFWTMSSLP